MHQEDRGIAVDRSAGGRVLGRVLDRLLAVLREVVGEHARNPSTSASEIALLHSLIEQPLEPKPVVAAETPPIAQWLHRLDESTSDAGPSDLDRRLVEAVIEASPELRWIAPYGIGDGADELFFGYTSTQLIGPDIVMRDYQAPFRHPEGLAIWFSLQAPHTLYPRHRHKAPEIYRGLSGKAKWQQGDRRWRIRRPGEWIFHRSHEGHAMQTDVEPLLSMAAWTDHLDAPMSVLDASPRAAKDGQEMNGQDRTSGGDRR